MFILFMNIYLYYWADSVGLERIELGQLVVLLNIIKSIFGAKTTFKDNQSNLIGAKD